MSYSIALANQKGGVGKTTSAINIGAALAEQSKRVLLIDFDPQGNLSSGLNVASATGRTIYELISGSAEVNAVVQHTAVSGLDVIPADVNLSGANVELISQDNREYFLKKRLAEIKQEYDYVLIDSPPSLEILTINGLVAADAVIVPLQCEYFALEGLKELLRSIRTVQTSFNRRLSLLGIVCTMYDKRTTLSQEVVGEVTEYFKEWVFQTVIPRNVRLAEAPSHGMPIIQYDSASLGAKSYRALGKEIITRAGR